jgi:hypothetical protein
VAENWCVEDRVVTKRWPKMGCFVNAIFNNAIFNINAFKIAFRPPLGTKRWQKMAQRSNPPSHPHSC